MLCSNDYKFGPSARCRGLDFTLLFSNILLSFVPALIFMLFALYRLILILPKKSRRLLPLKQLPLEGWALLLSRILLAAGFVGTNIALCVLWERSSLLGWQYSDRLASVLEVISAIVLFAIVIAEHFRNARPSQPAALYLLVSILFVACRIRTLALIGGASLPLQALSASLAIRCLLFGALQFSSRSSQIDGATLPPERTVGLGARYLVTWVLPLLWRGYRKPLGMKDLGEIDEDLLSKATWNAFSPHWAVQSARHKEGKTKNPMLRAAFGAFGMAIAAPLLPYLIASVVTLARPLIIGETISFVETYKTANPKPLSHGWGLVGAQILTYVVYALSTALAHIATQRCALALRGALMEALYRKSLLIKVETAREMGAAKASNLMSVDINQIVMTTQAIHDFWTAIVMTGLGLYIIYTQIGLSFLASVAGAMIFFGSLPLITRRIGKLRTTWAEATDRRVKFMSSVLKHIKAIKLSAYEPQITSIALTLRDTEIEAMRKWIAEILIVSTVTNIVSNFLALLTVTTYTLVQLFSKNDQGIQTSVIFTVISTIALLADPLRALGQQLGSIVSAWASWKRIEKFLLEEERDVGQEKTLEEYEMESATRPVTIRMKGSFGVKDKLTLLEKIDIDLASPALWMIVGRVGSGKSTLLQALLGELDLIEGVSQCSLGDIGYCSQDPWMLNNSIKMNITFMQPYEPVWYRTVMVALNLDVDLAILSDGDDTLVTNLSGGQKQRVALARAVYGKFRTYVLDDVFSALDATTEAHVFNALFGPQGLLKDKSVILATNQIYRLPRASYVTCLADGQIAEQGEYAELMASKGIMYDLIEEFTAGADDKGEDEEDETKDSLAEPVEDAKSEHSRPDEEVNQGKVPWSVYMLYLRSMGWGHVTIWIGMIVVLEAITISVNIYLQAWTTSLKPDSPHSRYGAFLGGYAGMQVAVVISFLIAIFNAFLYAHPIVSQKLHALQVRGLLGVSLDYFESRPVGQMINRFNSDLNMIDMTLPNHAVNTMAIGATIIGGVILIIVTGPYMAAVVAGTAIFMVGLQRFYVRAGRELRRLDLSTKSPIYTLFSETIDADGLRTIRAMGAQETCTRMMTERATRSQFPAWLLMVIRKWLELALNLCAGAINVLLVLIAVVKRNSISSGILAVALSMAAGMTTEFMILVVEWTNVEMCITSVERVEEYIKLPPQENRPRIREEWLNHGSIRFTKVSARYKPSLPPAISNISLTIKPGQRVGICGRSGSGKSTLLGVLWRLIDIDEDGEIMVDGRDISDIALGDYRSAMSIVPQDPLLLELSLRANLDPEGLHSDAEIWDALEKSHLKEHIEILPGKLDEIMAGDGGSFSRGQRQLLALARALLRQRHILALDEATSSIDAKTDAAIQHTIRTYFDNATVLTIAHRISTIIDYDLIVVMDQGRIIEMGEPATLLERQEAFYKLAVEGGAVARTAIGEGSGTA